MNTVARAGKIADMLEMARRGLWRLRRQHVEAVH